ncbi:uncharacterized protein LOC143187639 isoform X2 [Calliopsis andreniformis]|uniref:uncharacterized protein LOC143187639 isoform X2 n=1 Tax=Calliopsis andreniformis TaxID=337506 RepID=UPI003FCED89C
MICVTCVYWTLLFISVASSALLFIIVASENAQTNYYSSFRSNQTLETHANELDSIERDNLELPNIAMVKLPDSTKLTTNYKDSYYRGKFVTDTTNFETVINGDQRSGISNKGPNMLENLTQQTNLSERISESEDAAVLTFDTTATELQDLVEPQFNLEFTTSRFFTNTSSPLTKSANVLEETINEQQKLSPSTQIPSLPSTDEITEEYNESRTDEEEPSLLQNAIEEETLDLDEVVVVRAEQSPIITDESETSFQEKAITEMPKVDEMLMTTSELDDTANKALLVEHTGDEAAAIVFKDETIPVRSADSHEEIPSFNEWAQKRLEEAEKKKTHLNTSVQNSGIPTRGVSGMKVRSKNYASPDCGAKIVAANPEARSARSVLVSTRDEYMLNTCTSRIWFVVELCEAIQAKKIELANFELFSSSPKDFSVSISDRFPTRDWSLVGQFTAKDVKDTQSFILQPQLFGKFIKVELHTYYGSEHFCPISLFSAYGTSEFEVLETETESQVLRNTNVNVDDNEDGDEEEVLNIGTGEPPRNLFGSARDAVLSIVKKAAEVLVKSSDLTGNNITKIQQSIDSGNILEDSFVSCTTPRYTILCDNCSDQKFAKIFQLVSCREHQLNKLLKIPFVKRTLLQNGFCRSYGVRIETSAKKDREQELEKTKGTIRRYKQNGEKVNSMKNFQLTFLTSIFKPEYIAALCNVLAIKERKMVMNTSYEVPSNNFKDIDKEDKLPEKSEDNSNDAVDSFQHLQHNTSREIQRSNQDLLNEKAENLIDESVESFTNTESIALQIKPTKTLEGNEIKNDVSTPILESSKDSNEETVHTDTITTAPIFVNVDQPPVLSDPEDIPITSDASIENSHETTGSIPVVTIDNNESSHNTIAFSVDSLELPDTQVKIEKMERPDPEGRHKQADSLDQEIKLSSQDSLAFDSLLSDLKDLEGEAIHAQNGPAANPSQTHSTSNTMPQKESVFLRLSNRIKALERNMSLSGQYLEELSRRYKKQVEEMQRSLERTVSAMNEETRKWEERESSRVEEITSLRNEIANLSKSMKNLLYDRDSWHGRLLMMGQHLLLICSEVFIIFLILLYCRGTRKSQEKEKQLRKDIMRRKSAEHFSSHVKKTKKRRPSEIASNITGTYNDLMIDEKSCDTKKGRKKKRKKEGASKTNTHSDTKKHSILYYKSIPNVFTGDAMSRKSSSVEVLRTTNSQILTRKRPKSAPENTIDWLSSHDYECNVQPILSSKKNREMEFVQGFDSADSYTECITKSNSLPLSMCPEETIPNEQTTVELQLDVLNSRNSNVRIDTDARLYQSSFMKTALSARVKRKFQTNDENGKWSEPIKQKQDLNYSNEKSEQESLASELWSDNSTTNGSLLDQSDESRCSNDALATRKKDKKNTAFRKMVKKLFD